MWATQLLLNHFNKFYLPTIIPELDNDEPCEINYFFGEKAKEKKV